SKDDLEKAEEVFNQYLENNGLTVVEGFVESKKILKLIDFLEQNKGPFDRTQHKLALNKLKEYMSDKKEYLVPIQIYQNKINQWRRKIIPPEELSKTKQEIPPEADIKEADIKLEKKEPESPTATNTNTTTANTAIVSNTGFFSGTLLIDSNKNIKGQQIDKKIMKLTGIASNKPITVKDKRKYIEALDNWLQNGVKGNDSLSPTYE